MKEKLEVSYGLHSTYSCCIRFKNRIEIFTASDQWRGLLKKEDILVKARLGSSSKESGKNSHIDLYVESVAYSVWYKAQYISFVVLLPDEVAALKLDSIELSINEPRKYLLKILDLSDFLDTTEKYYSNSNNDINSISTLCSTDYIYASRYINYYSKIGINLFIIFLDLRLMGFPNEDEVSKIIDTASANNSRVLFIETDCNYVHRNTPPEDDSYIEGSGIQGDDFFYVLSPIIVNLGRLIASYSKSKMHINADLDEFSIYPGCKNGIPYRDYLINLMSSRNIDFDNSQPCNVTIREIPAFLNKDLDISKQNPLDSGSSFSVIPTNWHRNPKQIILNPSRLGQIFITCPHLPATYWKTHPYNKTNHYELPIKDGAYIHYINQSNYARKDTLSLNRRARLSDLVQLDPKPDEIDLCPTQILEIQKQQTVFELYAL